MFPTSSATATRSSTPRPTARSRSGSTCVGDHLLHLVRHAGHRVDDLAVADRAHADRARSRAGSGSPRRRRGCRPGAGCSRACRAGGRGTSSRSARRAPCARTSGTPISSAIASRVRSSWVGPRPPHTMTASARDNRSSQRGDDAGLVVADRRGARTSRCPTPRAARRSRRCSCRRSGRAAARCRSRGPHIARAGLTRRRSARGRLVAASRPSRAGGSRSPTRR